MTFITRRRSHLLVVAASTILLAIRAPVCSSFLGPGFPTPPSTSTTIIAADCRDQYRRPQQRLFATQQQQLPKIDSMRLREMKDELEGYGISTRAFLEKSELVEALQKARNDGLKPKQKKNKETTATTTTTTTTAGSSSSKSTGATASSTSSGSTTASSDTRSRDERLKEEMAKCQEMKASDLRKELKERGVSTASFFEKSEFVKALAEARVDGVSKSSVSGGGTDSEGYAEYTDVEVLTDDSAGPRKKQSQQQQQQSGGSPFGGDSAPPFGGGSPFGGGASPFGGMGGMGDIADMLKNMGMGGIGGGASPFGGGAAGANPFAGGANPFGGGVGGMGDAMGKAQELMKNPKVREIMTKAQSNPSIMKKVNECMGNPASFSKYQDDPDVKELIQELRKYM